MDSARFRRLSDLFDRAIALPAADRHALLEEIAAEDPTLRRELEELLAQHETDEGVLGEEFLEAGRAMIDDLAEEWPSGSGSARDDAFVLPDRIGRFRVVEEIGRGGVGVVIHAIDDDIGRDVAIKVLHDPDASTDLLSRFVEEGQIGGQLQHPSILPIYELGRTDDGHPMIVMKRVYGETLHSLLERRATPDSERGRFLGIFEQLCDGVAFAHAKLVIHRDLKPANVMVGSFGEVQVMDWGLAKLRLPDEAESAPSADRSAADRSAADRSTAERGTFPDASAQIPAASPPLAPADPPQESANRTGAPHPSVTPSPEIRTPSGSGGSSQRERSIVGTILGTPAYMAPEQARGEVTQIDARSDVFALGAILCKILVGRGPYGRGETKQVLRRARAGDLVERDALRALAADDPMAALALECLSEDPTSRPADAGEVAQRVRAHRLSLESRARKAEVAAAEERVRASGERRARRLITTIAALVVLGVLTGGGLIVREELERERRTSALEQRLARALSAAVSVRAEAERAGSRAIEKWNAAVSAARLAEELDSDEIGIELRTEVAELVADASAGERTARLIHRLDEIHESSAGLDNLSFGPALAGRYRQAFLESFGEDWFDAPADEIIARVRAHGADLEFARPIDLWARVIRQTQGRGSLDQRRLVEIADALDDDPWRVELRAASLDPSRERFRALHDSPAFDEQPPYALYVFAVLQNYEEEDFQQLSSILEEAQFLFPDDFTINYDLGWMSGDRATNLRFASAALVCSPESPFAHLQVGSLLVRSGESVAGWRHLDKARELAPESAQVIGLRANSHLVEENFELAEREYLECLQLADEKGEPATWHLIGYCRLLTLQRRYAEALDYFRRAEAGLDTMGLPPGEYSDEFWNNYGVCLKLSGDLEGAIEKFRRAAHSKNHRAMHLKNLGWALQDNGQFEEALEWFERALASAPGQSLILSHIAEVRARLGDLAGSWEAAADGLRSSPDSEFLRRLLESHLAGGAPVPESAVTRLRDTIAEIRIRDGVLPLGLQQLYLRTWIGGSTPDEADLSLAIAEEYVAAAPRDDPFPLRILAMVHRRRGEVAEAIRALERAERRAGGPSPISAELGKLRSSELPDLLTDGSVVALFTAGPHAPDREALAQIERDFRALPGTAERSRRLEIIHAIRAAERGALEEAIEGIHRAIRAARGSVAPYVLLHTWLHRSDPSAARTRFAATLAEGPLPAESLPLPPATPRVIAPQPAAVTSARRVRLEVTPLTHPDPRVAHVSSQWRVWAEGSDPTRTPLLAVESHTAKSAITLPSALLPPSGTYLWQCVQRADNGAVVRTEPTVLRTGAYPYDPVTIPLDEWFDCDVILDPEDPTEDYFDAEGLSLVVEGYDPAGQVSDVRGLPRDRRVGVHRLGDYREEQAIRLDGLGRESIEIEVPPDRYESIRFLVSGANGASSVPVRVLHLDGSHTDGVIHCPDWFDDPAPGVSLGNATPVLDRLDRADVTRLRDRDDPALFEISIEIDAPSPVIAIVLDFANGSLSGPGCRFHLFAITGMRALRD